MQTQSTFKSAGAAMLGALADLPRTFPVCPDLQRDPHLCAIRDFARDHGMIDAHIQDDAVVFGVEMFWPKTGRRAIQWEWVRTMRETREALGY